MPPELLVPDWPAPPGVRALQTLRHGGASRQPFDSFNLGDHVGDEAACVATNRSRLAGHLPAMPRWLVQVHGNRVVDLDSSQATGPLEADACISRKAGRVCAVLTADCLPLLLCDRAGSVVAAVHAGWRGLCSGVIEAALDRMAVPGSEVLAWLGPAIGPDAFEVGDEVRAAFVARDERASQAFSPGRDGRWQADLYALARLRLTARDVVSIHGGGACTFGEPARYFSYRRDGLTGRQASLIWLDVSPAAEGWAYNFAPLVDSLA